jgi:hypothetical protein
MRVAWTAESWSCLGCLSTTLPGSWFQKHMACGKNDVLYTVVLVFGTRNRSEWPLVRREAWLRWCSSGISTRLYTMRYNIIVWAYARLLCSVCQWSCCSNGCDTACALVISSDKPGGSTLYCLNLVDAVFFAGAPYAGCIF